MKIDKTQAYKALNPISQKLVMKRVNRTQIEDEIIIARNVGIPQWKAQTPLQERWQAIVIEIVDKEKETQQSI